MRFWLILLLLALPVLASAQSSEVRPGELSLTVTVDERKDRPLMGEMVLITIRGLYRRRITRETLRQPDLEGFNWAQLGPDHWTEERVGGRPVKILTRKMALYPVRPGTLTIGAFTHELTLTDEGDDWFDHRIGSQPVTVEVDPAPATDGWWFPVRRLQISDEWSNAPDQLKPGEGVLRVVRIEALGATPEMIPPMPDLTSPSAMIFPHPEQRLVELTPEGPVTYAYWRWTIQPTNDVSAIVEPLSFGYYDTVNRQAREVTISPQRVAYGNVTPDIAVDTKPTPVVTGQPTGWPLAVVATLVFAGGVASGMRNWRFAGVSRLGRRLGLDPLGWRLKRAARQGDGPGMRRAATAILRRDGPDPGRADVLAALDRTLFARETPGKGGLSCLARQFLAAGAPPERSSC